MFWAARALHWHSQRVQPWPRGLGNLVKLCRAGDRPLQLLVFNEEFLVSASHQLALITSLPFVHTARRYYRLNGLVRSSDWSGGGRKIASRFREDDQTWSFRGSKSRNKVSVGEPAEGSLTLPFGEAGRPKTNSLQREFIFVVGGQYTLITVLSYPGLRSGLFINHSQEYGIRFYFR